MNYFIIVMLEMGSLKKSATNHNFPNLTLNSLKNW